MAETSAAKRARARKIIRRLEAAYPDAAIALRFTTPLELLVATILAAQCTDERVNQVTETLFKKCRSAADYAGADPVALEREIHPTGFFRAKTRAILGMARALVERHKGEVPQTLEALTALPGVGRKTANVVLGNAFGIPGIAVDTHVFRVSQRLGLAKANEPDQIEAQLAAVVPRALWTRFCHLIQAHGRQVCHARTPACPACPVRALCPWPGKLTALGGGGGAKSRQRAEASERAPRRRPQRRVVGQFETKAGPGGAGAVTRFAGTRRPSAGGPLPPPFAIPRIAEGGERVTRPGASGASRPQDPDRPLAPDLGHYPASRKRRRSVAERRGG